jgi:hypothetical protein
MKKIYLMPEVFIHSVKSITPILTASPSKPIDHVNDEEADPESEVLGRRRRRNVWDDEEEEEEEW